MHDTVEELIQNWDLMDLKPKLGRYTWSNHRVGGENICKRLDRLLISADLLDSNFHFRQWVGCGGDSDHYPVYLQILNDDLRHRSPFKFNASWLVNEDLVSDLNDSWKFFDDTSLLSPASQFALNLKTIKDISIRWSVKKKTQDQKDLVDIELLLAESFNKLGFGFASDSEKLFSVELESKKRKILGVHEQEAR